jgi:hypothetical protein
VKFQTDRPAILKSPGLEKSLISKLRLVSYRERSIPQSESVGANHLPSEQEKSEVRHRWDV